MRREVHTAVWTGSEMIVWGGDLTDCNGFEHWREIQSRHRQLDSHQHHQRARCAERSHGSLDRQRNDRLGWFNSWPRFNTGGRYCAATAPSAPIAEPATYVASYSFTANWSSVSGATGYRLDVSMSSSFSTYVPGYQNLNVGNATSRSVTGLNPSTTYHYRVRAYNGHAHQR